jgi:large subunit ribosomal protein L4
MQMKWDVINTRGETVKQVDLPQDVFGLEMNEPVLHTVVKAYQANRRQGTHATKTRSMVSGTGKKPFKQKGTGGARQGCSRSPLMPGGAVLHGPQPRDYRQAVNRKQRLLALKVALSDKVRHKKLIIVDNFEIAAYGTKAILERLKVFGHGHNVMLCDARTDDFLYKSARNIFQTGSQPSMEVNAEDILRHESLILSEAALKTLADRLGA